MELPEVQTIVSDLRKTVVGLVIKRVDIVKDQCIAPLSNQQFNMRIREKIIVDVQRYAKYIVFTLNDGQSLVIHLKMTGQLHYAVNEPSKMRYLNAIIWFQNGTTLAYCDKLKWGRWSLLDRATPLHIVFANLGPDLLKNEITSPEFYEMLSHSKVPVHSFLLDQKNVVGIGNIYANEALFRARIHPQQRSSTISQGEAERLFNALVRVLNDAIRCRGTTFSDYHDLFGEKGHYQDHLQVFKRSGQPCYHCGGLIQRDKVRGRSIFFCPRCQDNGREVEIP